LAYEIILHTTNVCVYNVELTIAGYNHYVFVCQHAQDKRKFTSDTLVLVCITRPNVIKHNNSIYFF